MPVAGNGSLVYAKSSATTPGSGDEVAGLTSCTYSHKANLLDVTTLKDTTGFVLKATALQDGTVQVSGFCEASDAPQALLRSSISGASVWMTFQYNPSGSAGSKGFQVECKVESWEIKSEVGGMVSFSGNLAFTGAPVAV